MNVEHGTFTSLVFSVNGGMAKDSLKFQKFVAEKIANKSGCSCEKVLSIIKCKLSFLIFRASLTCVRGSRSLTTHSGNHAVDDFEIAFDYTLGWDLLIWDLKGRVCFWSLINIFVPVHPSTLSFSCIFSVLSHTAPTGDTLCLHSSTFLTVFWISSNSLTLLWQRSLWLRKQSINLQCKSSDWFLYHREFRQEKCKEKPCALLSVRNIFMLWFKTNSLISYLKKLLKKGKLPLMIRRKKRWKKSATIFFLHFIAFLSTKIQRIITWKSNFEQQHCISNKI